MVNWLAFDTETTGLGKTARIIQIAWQIHDESNQIICSDSFTVKPDDEHMIITNTNIHGLTTEMVEQGHDLPSVLRKMLDDIEKYNVTRIVAHNMSFDFPMVKREMMRHEMYDELLKFEKIERACTMLLGRKKGYRPVNLQALYEQVYGSLPEEAILHTADWDTRLCADIYCKFNVNALHGETPTESAVHVACE